MAANITPAQYKLLTFIDEWIDEHDFPPTVRELGLKMQTKNPNAIGTMLKSLQAKGLITKQEHRARTLKITPLGHQALVAGIVNQAPSED